MKVGRVENQLKKVSIAQIGLRDRRKSNKVFAIAVLTKSYVQCKGQNIWTKAQLLLRQV